MVGNLGDSVSSLIDACALYGPPLAIAVGHPVFYDLQVVVLHSLVYSME